MKPLTIGGRINPDGFWERVDKTAGPLECWPWTATLSRGYGQLSIRGKRARAPRVALALVGRPVPAGLIARHTCDNRACVNPAHLLAGTYVDNARDASDRLRWRHGRLAYNSKLSDDAVRDIRRQLAVGIAQAVLAREYDVSERLIYGIKNGQMWRHVA